MAKAISKTVIEERIVEVEVSGGVELALTDEEASFLLDITWRIGGDPVRSRRGLSDSIRRALEDAGAKRLNVDYNNSDIEQGMVFADRQEDCL